MKKTIAVAVMMVAAVAGAQLRRSGAPNLPGRNNNARGGSTQASAGSMTAEDLKNVPKGTNGVPALAFKDAPMDLVLEAYAEQVQKTILPAPDLPKATINLKSLEGQTLTKEEYLEAIEAVLTMNGIVLEPRGEKFLRALTRKTVRTQGIPLLMNLPDRNFPEKSRVISQMITFQNIAVAEAQKALEGFKDPAGLFQVFERTNAILVTDTQENVNRMLEIVKAIDIASPVLEDVFVRQVKFAVANDIKTALETIVTESQKDQPKDSAGPKTSGTPGFSRQNNSSGSRLLNLNNRPGVPQAPTPNETLLAAVSDADRGMIRGKVLILADERSNKLIIITMKSNMDFFDRVIETLDVETEPEFKVEVIRLRFADSEDVASMLNDLIGTTGGSATGKGNQNQNAKNATNTKQNITQKGPATATGAKGSVAGVGLGDLNKDNCKVLSDKRINGIVVMTRTELMPIIKSVIDSMDVKLSQVLIETVIVEVSLGDDIQTGMDWVQRGKTTVTDYNKVTGYQQKLTGYQTATATTDDDGNEVYSDTAIQGKDGKWYEPVYEWVAQYGTKTERGGLINRNSYALGGGGGLQTLATAAASAATNDAVYNAIQGFNPSAAGVNYFLKSDKLNIAAIIQASQSDSRSKYLASPIVMTVDNKEATIEATQMRYLLTGYTYSGNTYSGSTVPNYEQKEIGLTIKVTPKINPDGTVMLTVEENYSQVGANQTIQANTGGDNPSTVTVPTTITRKMSADILLDNMQTVVLGGLTETSKSESETGIPILKDIPYIGKYLFGSTSTSEARKELLVFMTPYVLDDGAAAQAEALRRKKSLSDSRAWEDNGWSASLLADPVSKKEQLRRFEDEWKRQDEERKTKLAIEKAKLDRAKKLEAMDDDERKFWIELHKDELEKDEKAAFEEELKHEKDQKRLKELAARLREEKLEKAEGEIKAMDARSKAENERGKLDAEKRKREMEKAAKAAEGKAAAEKAAHVEAVKDATKGAKK